MGKSLKLVQMLCPQSKWGIKCPYPMMAEGITVHNTANKASARAEISYMITNNNEVSYHIAVDDKEAVQGIPFDRNTWHASDGANGGGNRKTISIEICYSTGDAEKFRKSEDNAAYLIAAILTERGWDITHVKKHQDFCGKYCPHRTLDLGWIRFLKMIESYMFEPIKYGRDYSPVFDAEYYDNHNEDLQKAFNHNKSALFEHFLTYGVYEGRQACATFSVNDYIILNPDLEPYLHSDKGAYAQHYIDYGIANGRKGIIV